MVFANAALKLAPQIADVKAAEKLRHWPSAIGESGPARELVTEPAVPVMVTRPKLEGATLWAFTFSASNGNTPLSNADWSSLVRSHQTRAQGLHGQNLR